jgi:hypothetical protein
MEPSGRNRWQPVATGVSAKTAKSSKTVAVDCDRLPEMFHRKEGVDGSSSSEGSRREEIPVNRGFLLPEPAPQSTTASPSDRDRARRASRKVPANRLVSRHHGAPPRCGGTRHKSIRTESRNSLQTRRSEIRRRRSRNLGDRFFGDGWASKLHLSGRTGHARRQVHGVARVATRGDDNALLLRFTPLRATSLSQRHCCGHPSVRVAG